MDSDTLVNFLLILSTIRIGVTLSGFFSAGYGAPTIAPDVGPLSGSIGLGSAAGPAAFFGMMLLVVYLSLVLGERATRWRSAGMS